jgi:hypothetical protein
MRREEPGALSRASPGLMIGEVQEHRSDARSINAA